MTYLWDQLKISRIKSCEAYSNHIFGSLELPESYIDGDTTLTLGFQLIENPS